MTDMSAPQSSKVKRRSYVVDPKMQVGVAGRILVPLACVATLMVAAVYFALGRHETGFLSADDLRAFLILAIAIYFTIAFVVVLIVSLLVTHRVAGPELVIRHALEGILEGDYTRRLTVRKYDYLQELAERVAEVRRHLLLRQGEWDSALAQLHLYLARNDPAGAARLLAELRGIDPAHAPRTATARQPETAAAG